MTVLVFMIIMSVMVISGRSVRKNELEKTLNHAVKQSLKALLKEENKEVNTEEFIETFIENLSAGIESDSEIIISVMGIDTEKGVFSVRAKEEFWHPFGKKGKVEAERTVIIEQYNIEKKELYTVSYNLEGAIYKLYRLTQGSRVQFPAIEKSGFLYWVDEEGNRIDAGDEIIVATDRRFDAIME